MKPSSATQKILSQIKKPIGDELLEFNTFFKKKLETDVALLNIILRYVTKKKGKQIRPILVLLSAGMCGGICRRTYNGASMVELLHTATLIHDDVIDSAKIRRGIASVNSEWNNKIAVLVGDYLLSMGLLSSIDSDEFKFLKSTSKSVKAMSESELMSLDKSKKFKIDEPTYLKIIKGKTATLMASCCEIGAISANDDTHIQEKMESFGMNLGMAFQLRDDLFDYTSKRSIIGKPVGNDLREKKMTLPLIHALGNCESSLSSKIIKSIKKGKLTKSEISKIISFVNEYGGVDYTQILASQYTHNSKQLISSFPESKYKSALEELGDFIVQRES